MHAGRGNSASLGGEFGPQIQTRQKKCYYANATVGCTYLAALQFIQLKCSRDKKDVSFTYLFSYLCNINQLTDGSLSMAAVMGTLIITFLH